MPSIDKITKIIKFFLRAFKMFLCLIIKMGLIIKKAKNHLKKDNSKGVMSSFIYLPITKFIDQNNTHKVTRK